MHKHNTKTKTTRDFAHYFMIYDRILKKKSCVN